jgi:hypothetical protein
MIALGDIIERCLRFFGITKERVQAATGKKDCGCAKRQAELNSFGYRWQNRLMMPLHWLQYQWQTVRHGQVAVRLWMAGRYLRMAWRVLLYGR